MGCATRLVIFGVIFLIGAAFYGYFEMRYAMSGKETMGTVTDIRAEERRGRRGRRYTVDVCHFNYENEDGLQSGKCELHGLNVTPGEDFPVEYLPGTDTARLKGAGDMGMVAVFGGLGTIGLIVGLLMMRGGGEPGTA